MNLYKEELTDHYRYPRNKGVLANANFKAEMANFSCGDKISFTGIIQENKFIIINFDGSGCVISQALASMLTEQLKNQTIDFLKNITQADIIKLAGIDLGPTRLKCALLSWQALLTGLEIYNKCLINSN